METSESGEIDACPGCGIPGSPTACQGLFEAALVRDFSDHRYAKVHRLMVDTYALQHPDRYMRSEKSFAAHLTGLCAALERDEASRVNQAVQRWLDGSQDIYRPAEIPESRGDLTIEHIGAADDPEEHVRRVREWAQSVWSAWSEHQNIARAWIEEAIEKASDV